ncbi:MAG: carboxypeptidase regulatory-like domain-containing protein, partial [Thaumarchaeota archaeon]|nr:carboxypeptidase regulatory-like domain-containing protein [Nitrososphaerota archaeon]
QWTVDGTGPTVNTTTPANASYIYGTITQLFRAYFYDDTLNTSNVTVYHRRGVEAWKNAALTCYNLTTANISFICNTTLNMPTWYGNGDVVQFYFIASDNSRISGSNGTVGNPLTVTIDQGVLTYANNGTNVTVVGKYGGVKIYANWSNTYTLDYAVLETNETGAAKNYTDGTYGSPYNINLSSGETWSNFSWSNSSLTPGQGVQWRIFANDSAGNANVTTAGAFSIDNSIPVMIASSSNTTNASTIAKGASISVSGNWTDNIGLGYYKISHNETGEWSNTTAYRFAATNNSNSSGIINTSSATVGVTFQIKMYANDSSGNENASETWQYTIDNTVPTTIAFSSNTSNASTIAKGVSISLSANWTDNVELHYYWINTNSTGSLGNGSATQFSATNNSNSTAIVNATAAVGSIIQAKFFANDTSGNQNASEIWQWTIDNTVPASENITSLPTSPTEYSPGKTYIFNVSATDNIAINKVLLEWNGSTGTNYSASIVSGTANNYSYTITDLSVSAANYTYRWMVNDTSNNWNVSAVQTFNITRNATNPINLYLNTVLGTNLTVSYPTPVNATATSVYVNSGAVNLYRNDSSANTENATNVTLGNGTYVYVANTSGTVNYTSNSTTLYAYVIKGYVAINLALNGTEGSNVSYTYPAAINATVWKNATTASDYNMSIYRNGTIVNSTTSANSRSENIILANGTYNYTLVFDGSTNYTSNSTTLYAFVNKGVSNISLWIGSGQGTEGNISSHEQGVTANFTAIINTSYTVGFNMTVNISGWGQKNSSANKITNTTATSNVTVGNYNVTAWFDGDQNYTSDSQIWWLNITADITAPTVLVNYTISFENGTYVKTGSSIVVNISVNDTGVGMPDGATCNVTIGGTVATNITYLSGWCNGTVTVPSISTDGNKTFNVTIGDKNGNVGQNSTFVVSIDNTPPIVSISTPANASYVKVGGGNRVWINGSVSDNLALSGNVTANYTNFTTYSFNGTNATNFAIYNTSSIADGYIAIRVNFTDRVGNIGNATVYFYEDNTAPSAVYGLTNSSSLNYAPTTGQTMNVLVTDVQQTNETVILNYYLNGTWFTKALTGTPSTSTTYTGTISTMSNTTLYDAISGKGYMPYYVTGTDNATNSITNGGSVGSPLGNLTFGGTGVIQGYVYLTNTSIVPNGTVRVSDGTRTVSTDTAGLYQITSVPATTYTLTVSGTGYRTNSTSVTVTAGATTTQNMRITGAESFNITLPGTSGSSATGFWDTGWHDFYFATRMYSAGSTNYTVEYLFFTMGVTNNYNYTAVWRYNATNQTWASFVPQASGNTLVNVSSSDDHYWVYVNATDRVEFEPRYV